MESKILIINEVAEDSQILMKGVEESEYSLLCELDSISKVFLDFHEPPIAAIYNLKSRISDYEQFFIEKSLRLPMTTIVFVKAANKQEIEQAVKAGIHALIVNGLDSQRVPAIVDTAIYRFSEQQKKEKELMITKQNLQDRKVIEKAKGILMDIKGISENEAYTSLRKLAMDENKKIIDVSNDVIKMMRYIA